MSKWVLAVAALLGAIQMGYYLSLPDKLYCAPIPQGIAVCLNRASEPVPWSTSIKLERGEYGTAYAPLDVLIADLGANAFVSSDHKHVTVNGKELPKTNGVTNTG